MALWSIHRYSILIHNYLPDLKEDNIESCTICSVSTSLATSPCILAPLFKNLVPAYLLLLLAISVKYTGLPKIFRLLCTMNPWTM